MGSIVKSTKARYPPYVRRFYWLMGILPLVVAVLLILAGILHDYLPRLGFVTSGSIAIGVVGFAVLWLSMFGVREKRLMQRLRAADYKVCLHCAFDLTGHTGQSKCPECGKAFDIIESQTSWRSWQPRVYRIAK
jgi:predicted RNA-binding Zn-ribbon protein involved in translation (DUF1610 family)